MFLIKAIQPITCNAYSKKTIWFNPKYHSQRKYYYDIPENNLSKNKENFLNKSDTSSNKI